MKIKDMPFVPLTNDLLFKEVLCSEENREVLIDFIETFTSIPKNVINTNLVVEYESPIKKNNYFEKGMTGDVIVRFKNYIINIEMYSYFNNSMLNKSFCYSMKIFSNNIKRGKKYEKLESFIQINLVDNVQSDFNSNFKSAYALTDLYNENNKLLVDKFTIKFYRIDNANSDLYNLNRENKWVKFIGAKTEEERLSIARGDKVLEKMNENIDNYIVDRETREMFLEWKRQCYIECATAEGRTLGKLEVSKKLKDKGFSTEEIKELTGLNEEEIEKL